MKNDLDKLTTRVRETRKIGPKTEYAIKKYHPLDLLVPERLDLVAKYKFLDYLEGKNTSKYPLELYKKHLYAFSGGIECSEAGDDNKNNFHDYVESFKNTANSIKNGGFDSNVSLVPVGQNDVIMDGAHRVASAIYYNKSIDCIVFNRAGGNYGAKFFEEHLLDKQYIDFMVLEYCKMKKNTFVFCVWPKADQKKRPVAYDIIRKKTHVIHEKTIDLNYLGYRNFVIQVYRDFSNWIGNADNHYKGANSQLDSCYIPGVPLKIFVVEADSKQAVVNIKKEIRDIFGIGNFSIHSTDNQLETIYMLNILLNKNSVDLLNHGKPDCYVRLEKEINRIRNKIVAHHLNPDDMVIVSSSVLGLYNLREPGDIDYMAKSDDFSVLDSASCEKNNKYLEYYAKSLDDLLYDPNNYLFYNGIKFITLDVLAQYKKNRSRKKDLEDVKMIEQFKKLNGKNLYIRINKVKMSLRRVKGRARLSLVHGLKRAHLYGIARRIVKGKKQ